MKFQLKRNTITEELLKEFLEKNFSQFHHSFAKMCIDTNYSHKLIENATTFEIWDASNLVGIICAYLNYELKTAYIPYVCISANYSGRGLASSLIDSLQTYCKEQNLKKISLEVRDYNMPAISLYVKNGFKQVEKYNGKIKMTKYISI